MVGSDRVVAEIVTYRVSGRGPNCGQGEAQVAKQAVIDKEGRKLYCNETVLQ